MDGPAPGGLTLTRSALFSAADLAALIDARQKLEMQATENEGVAKQLKALRGDDKVFKKHGPALLPLSPDEARDNVSKRLDLIRGETERIEAKISDGEKRLSATKESLAKLQQEVIDSLIAKGDIAPPPARAPAPAA